MSRNHQKLRDQVNIKTQEHKNIKEREQLSMNILFASYEAAPFFKKGGLGDVAGSLPVALGKIGVKVTLVLPGYKFLKLPNKTQSIVRITVNFNHKQEAVEILKMNYLPNYSLLVIKHPFLETLEKGAEKDFMFVFFCKCVSAMISLNSKGQFGRFDLIHLHDWHTAAIAYFVKNLDRSARLPTILTIHNLMYQGWIAKEKLSELIESRVFDSSYANLMELGIKFADFITTVSPTYAKEIIKTRKGLNLKSLLVAKKDSTDGIINGIDYKVWDPQTDKQLAFKYDLKSVNQNKLKNKLAMQKELKLPLGHAWPLVSYIGRLEPQQKGIDLICKMLAEKMPEKNFQMVILGTGHPVWAKRIGSFVGKYPKNVVFINKFDENLSHRIYASSDIILIPSRFEPCGLVQMIAMRYGSLPLVRKTGGLADTVRHQINGFVFEKYSASELKRTLNLAIKTFNEQPEKYNKMITTAMKEDFSWDQSAKQYKKLYQMVIRENKSTVGNRSAV